MLLAPWKGRSQPLSERDALSSSTLPSRCQPVPSFSPPNSHLNWSGSTDSCWSFQRCEVGGKKMRNPAAVLTSQRSIFHDLYIARASKTDKRVCVWVCVLMCERMSECAWAQDLPTQTLPPNPVAPPLTPLWKKHPHWTERLHPHFFQESSIQSPQKTPPYLLVSPLPPPPKWAAWSRWGPPQRGGGQPVLQGAPHWHRQMSEGVQDEQNKKKRNKEKRQKKHKYNPCSMEEDCVVFKDYF